MEFKIRKTIVRFDFSFLLIIALSIVLKGDNVLGVLLFSCLHEIGHILSLLLLGGYPDKIVFSFYGIGLTTSSRLSYFKECIFLCAGMLVNALLAIIGVGREINLALLILNALPIYPLDMGRIFKIAFEKLFFISFSQRAFDIITVVFVSLLFVLSVYIKNVNLVLISIYLFVYWLNRGYV